MEGKEEKLDECSDCRARGIDSRKYPDVDFDLRWVWIETPEKIHYKTTILCKEHRDIFRGLGFTVHGEEGGEDV